MAESRGGDIKTKTSFFLFAKIEWRDSPLTVAGDTKKEGAQHSEHPREILTNHPAFAKGEPYANSSTFF